MAHETRHAAWQTERRFAVRILPEDGPAGGSGQRAHGVPRRLRSRLRVGEPRRPRARRNGKPRDRRDARRRRGGSLDVHARAAGARLQPVELAGGRRSSRAGSGSRDSGNALSDRRSGRTCAGGRHAPSPPPPPVFVAPPEPEIVRTAEVGAPRETPRQWLRTWVRAAWNDRLARCCLIGSGASLWFSVGLADPQFLLPLAPVPAGVLVAAPEPSRAGPPRPSPKTGCSPSG